MSTLTDLFKGFAAGDALTTQDRVVILLTGLIAVAAVAAVGWMLHRTARAAVANLSAGRGNRSAAWTGRRVLIVVAVSVAFAVAGIGGVQSFRAVSDKFHSPLVPLVADGMVIACTALRLAALTRGWRIPGALFTTYVFIGGTVALNIDAANGAVDVAIAHALAPLAYAVLVEMLAHMLRLHLKLSQPPRPKLARLSVLTWLTSPVITTRVWLHLARTGSDDPAAARALVQQVVRMSSRLSTVCPSRRVLPLDSARSARSAALQTIRDGLLTAGQLAALLPAADRMSAGQLLALVDSAALGLPVNDDQDRAGQSPAQQVPAWLVLYLVAAARRDQTRDQIRPVGRFGEDAVDDGETGDDATASVLPLIVGYVFGALHHQDKQNTERAGHSGTAWSTPSGAPLHVPNSAPAPHHASRSGALVAERPTPGVGAGAPVHHVAAAPSPAPAAARDSGASVISAPVAEPAQSSSASGAGSGARTRKGGRGKRSDESYVAELVEVSRREHGGQPLGLREIVRVTGVGFPKAKRLAGLAGWAEPDDHRPAEPGVNGHDDPETTDANSNNQHPEETQQQTEEAHELEMSNH